MKSSDRRRGEQDGANATLAAVHVALDSGRADGDSERDRQLGRLALILRAGAPAPSAAFETQLERDLEAGFDPKRANGPAAAPRRSGARRRHAAGIGGFDRRLLGVFPVALLALAVGGGLLATVGVLVDGGGYPGG